MLRLGKDELHGRYALVLGGGKFGTIAARFLAACGSKIIIVDLRDDCEAHDLVNSVKDPFDQDVELEPGEVVFLACDALDFFERFIKIRIPFIVVTAITKHFAGIYAEKILKAKHKISSDITCIADGFDGIAEEIDYGVFEEYGIATASYMPFGMVCPEDCYPGKVCTVTGKPRGRPMYEILEDVMSVLDLAVVLPSYQLGRGVGGVMGEDLIRMRDQFERFDEGNCGIATACLCHGVINTFRVERRDEEVS
ncbi:MAG: hypothetical protein ACXQS6_01000 [Candidatus Syntropharchaeales archaeon]